MHGLVSLENLWLIFSRIGASEHLEIIKQQTLVSPNQKVQND